MDATDGGPGRFLAGPDWGRGGAFLARAEARAAPPTSADLKVRLYRKGLQVPEPESLNFIPGMGTNSQV